MSARLRTRPSALPKPGEKLAWAEARLSALRARAAEGMRALMADLEEAATRLEFAAEQPELGARLTGFAARAEALDRLSFDILYTSQIAAELRAAGVGDQGGQPAPASAPHALHAPRDPRPAPAPDPAASGSAGVSQSDIDALIKARAKAS